MGYYEGNPNVLASTIDCTRHKPHCHRFGVKRYPKFLFIRNGERVKDVLWFDGERRAGDMISFANQIIHETQNEL
jgi:hypothetical protein